MKMVEPETAVGAGLALWSMKDVLVKLLGPTADYLGEGLKSYTEKGAKNLRNIFEKGVKKVGKKINEPGQVPPKVLKGILSEGYFCEDELSAEYFGGVLASSRSGISRDDRGTTYISLISSLSTYQIQMHFILYSIVRREFLGKGLDLGIDKGKMAMYIPYSVYRLAMDFQATEPWHTVFVHSVTGLDRLELIHTRAYGDRKHLHKYYSEIEFRTDGLIFFPTPTGMDLYYWAHGRGNITYHDFFKSEVVLKSPSGINISAGAFSIEEEKRKQREKKEDKET